MAVRMELHLSNRTERIYDACVIGAGASGLVCAAILAGRGLSTLVIEQNKKSGRKLYATGNGRCNLANAVISDSAYYGNAFATQVVTDPHMEMLKEHLLGLGIPLTEREGYFYPQSLQASSVVWALNDAALHAGVAFQYDTQVTDVLRPAEGGFLIRAREKHSEQPVEIQAERLVLAAGSPAAAHLGSGKAAVLQKLFQALDLGFRPFEPALCPLETDEDVSALAGVRTKAVLTLEPGNTVGDTGRNVAGNATGNAAGNDTMGSVSPEDFTEIGELQLTDYGISGIAVFNLATIASAGDRIRIDLLPAWNSPEELLKVLSGVDPGRRVLGVMNGFLHDKLCGRLLEECFGPEGLRRNMAELTMEDRMRLIHTMKNWRLTVKGKKGDQGQACQGGVLTSMVDPDTMRVSAEGSILAVTGEALDVVGRCGGYNLMFAMISGILAGRNL